MQAARASPLYTNVTDTLAAEFAPWNGTRLDVSGRPFIIPHNGTLDRYIADHWNCSLHVYGGIFFESLRHPRYVDDTPVATFDDAAGLSSGSPGAEVRVNEAEQMWRMGGTSHSRDVGVGLHMGDGLGRKSQQQYVEFTVMVNQTAKHALPLVLNEANNGVLRALLAEQAGDEPAAVPAMRVTLQPFPKVATERRVRPPAPLCTR